MKRPERETDPYSGQVCLPGGALEIDDASLLDCALREADEELGIPAHSVEIISELQWQETGFKHESGGIGFMKPVSKTTMLQARRSRMGCPCRSRGEALRWDRTPQCASP